LDSKIKIAVLPLDITWCDCKENLLSVEELLPKLCPDTDILVLPELFSTGFIQEETLLKEVAASQADKTLDTLKRWSREFNMAISGSYIAKVGNSVVNRGFFIEPSGEETFYDKRHLFCLSMESRLFSSGHTLPPVIRFRGWNVSLIVCYDLRFPAWCRNKEHKGYDIMLVPANWPSARKYAWRQLLIARAIENQAIVVGANRSGSDDYGEYTGLSYIFDPAGQDITVSTGPDSPFLYAEYTRSRLEKIRTVLPFSNDADDVIINLTPE